MILLLRGCQSPVPSVDKPKTMEVRLHVGRKGGEFVLECRDQHPVKRACTVPYQSSEGALASAESLYAGQKVVWVGILPKERVREFCNRTVEDIRVRLVHSQGVGLTVEFLSCQILQGLWGHMAKTATKWAKQESGSFSDAG